MEAEKLIEDLEKITNENLVQAEYFQLLTEEKLNYRKDKKSWNILECIEHLNRYGDFYIPEIEKQMDHSNFKASSTFKSGLLGNYFAKSMLPKDKLNKMKALKSMNPMGAELDSKILEKFIRQQDTILQLLNRARDTDLTKIKTSISISKWIKLRLGDTFRVLIYHNLRHIVQARKVLDLD